LSKIVIGRQFCGPPNSGNGGYVCGVLAKGLGGPVTAVIRAPVPLDRELPFVREGGANLMLADDGALIGKGEAVTAELPAPPLVPTLEAAEAAGARYRGHAERFHPICFTCGTDRQDGDGLRVFAGPLEGGEPGVVAAVWTPHAAFAEADGCVSTEALWAALDCPGYFAWVEREGRHGALLGTMTGEVLRRPRTGEACALVAWPIAREGRKEFSGVALFDAEGNLLARAHQVWIVMGPRGAQSSAEPATTAA
jgi:hypothetical protein